MNSGGTNLNMAYNKQAKALNGFKIQTILINNHYHQICHIYTGLKI